MFGIQCTVLADNRQFYLSHVTWYSFKCLNNSRSVLECTVKLSIPASITFSCLSNSEGSLDWKNAEAVLDYAV